ncbi:hypothetical protein [Klebsiella aerogenes]
MNLANNAVCQSTGNSHVSPLKPHIAGGTGQNNSPTFILERYNCCGTKDKGRHEVSCLSTQQIHDQCLATTQQAIETLGWTNISVGILSDEERRQLEDANLQSHLDWRWAMRTYSGNAEDGILDITLKLIDRDEPEQLHAVIICKYDWLREQFSICMLENFILDEDTDLTGNVLIIALIYATTFCQIAELEDVYIQDPTEGAQPRYRSYGFAQVWYDHSKMSADVCDILNTIRWKVNGIDPDEE